MSKLYDNPRYYEIAFSFRDIQAEVDLFEECFRRFSNIEVKSALELGCGHSPHMEELVSRGYQYNGLDLSREMLKYSKDKALRLGLKANLVQADMMDFTFQKMVDFVYVLLGSLHAQRTSDLVTHFNSVAQVLNKGGLYLLDWCIQYDPPGGSDGGDTWEVERHGVRVKTTVTWKPISRVEQTFEETIALAVDDHGKPQTIIGKDVLRAIYPQEFLCLVSRLRDFEFVGWWNNWDLTQPLEKASKIDRPIALLRRT
mgnify:CR=1 FL=1